MRLRYLGPGHFFVYGEHRFAAPHAAAQAGSMQLAGAAPILEIPQEVAEELLTYPGHRFEQVAGEDAPPTPRPVFAVETAPPPGPQPVQPAVSLDAAPHVPQPEPPAAPQA